METTNYMTVREAWDEFWETIKDRPTWKAIPLQERRHLSATNKAVRKGEAKALRVFNTIQKQMPGRYEMLGEVKVFRRVG